MTKLQDFLNSAIKDVAPMPRKARPGDLYGIELECEGKRVDWDGSVPKLIEDWAPHADGSLRANHGSCCEWVFNGPATYKQSVGRVKSLFEYFEKRKAQLVTSNRTSTHVHFNMGDKNVYQLVNLFIVFTIVEDILDRYCGEDRNGNLFCLSSRHAEEQIRWISDMCFKNYRIAFNDNYRYTSLNLAAINKFGTVEFRGMRGLDNEADILSWLGIINDLCEYACYKMKNPVTLIEEISVKRPIGFLKDIFSKENYAKITKELTDEEINHSIFEGLRLVQMLCYKIGTEFDQVRLRGRDFWASFSGDIKPEKDVNPEDFAAGGLMVKPARAPAFRLRAEPGAQGIPQPADAQIALEEAVRAAEERVRVRQAAANPEWFNRVNLNVRPQVQPIDPVNFRDILNQNGEDL